MKIVKWIVQGFLALSFFAGAGFRLVSSYEDLQQIEGMGWVNDLSPLQVKIIALLEVLGAIGLIVPMFVRKVKFLVPLAAIGLALTMIGAAILHISRDEPIYVNLWLFALAVLVAYWRKDLLGSGEKLGESSHQD